MDRRQELLDGLKLDGIGLEIGPMHSPIAAGEPGLEVKTLDHLDQAGLVAKYAPTGVDVSKIQPVDYVWAGERYIDLVGDQRFDWILASHVIEHVPDLVGFINQCAEILTPGGTLSLAVPDKRATFDFYRQPTGVGPIIDAHLNARRLSSPGLAAEFALNFSDPEKWERGATVRRPVSHGPDVARRLLEQATRGEYVDIHAWVFTPNSFRVILEDLHALGLTRMRERYFGANRDFEFVVHLSEEGPGPQEDLEALRELALQDLMVEDSRVPSLQEENARLAAQVEALTASTSWRITGPLRAMRRLASGG